MNKVRTCNFCHYWEMGIPCGHCEHPNALFMFTNDDMVFRDAGKSCPLNNPEYRAEKLKDVDNIICELQHSCEKVCARSKSLKLRQDEVECNMS